MKFSTISSVLYEALDAVSGALPGKPDKEILDCILLQRQGDSLELQATDLEIAIRHRVPVEFLSEPNEELDLIAIPSKQLLESCRTLPEVPITLSVDLGYSIALSHELGQYEWMGFDGNSFPDFPVIEDAQSIKFDRTRLKAGFNLVGFAVAKDISRPGMLGILFEVLQGSARIVATDGHRLARCIFKNYIGELDTRALAPVKTFQQVARIEGPNDCTIQVSENLVSFGFGSTEIVSRLINASFPDYERALPDENDKVVHTNRDDLLNSVRRVNFFASTNSNLIVLDCMDDQIRVNATDIERSRKGAETVSCSYNNEPTQIGFNAQYLQEMIRNLPATELTLSMGIPSRAALLRPAPQGDFEDLTFLIMPIMLNKLD